MEFLPALSILGAFLLVVMTLIIKFKTDDLTKLLEGKNFFLIATLIAVIVLVVFHLFKSEAWTADLLKIALGVFAGAGAVAIKDKDSKSIESANNTDKINQEITGNDNKVAGRDINETVQNIKNAVSDMKDAIVKQNIDLKSLSIDNSPMHHAIHMLFSRQNFLEQFQKVVDRRIKEGWTLKNITIAYEQHDGIILIFTKPCLGDEYPECSVERDANFERLYPK